jgi:xanthine dehydrogenase large subunit
MGVVGKNIPHDSAVAHVTGESQYVDDMPPLFDEVLVDFVGSPVASGKIKSIDITAAQQVPGVVGVFTYKNVPGHNDYGPIVRDDRALAAEDVRYVGEPIVLLVGESRAALQAAKRLVKMDVEATAPIFSIDESIAAHAFLGPERLIARGDVNHALAAAKHRLAGDLFIAGQEQFYFETQAAIAMPEERGGMTIYSSTQHTSEVQAVVGEVCGLPFHRVTCICRRMGGGFGGKETQAAQYAALAALAAILTKRPARFVLNRDDDMAITGKRHPFRSFYEVGFDDAAKITAISVRHFSDGGCSTDLSPSILERAMLHTDNAYYLPTVRITGRVCRTNHPSNTAFRGFGGPQGVVVIENIIEEIAQSLGMDALDVRLANVYQGEGVQAAPYGQLVRNNTLPEIIAQLEDSSNYRARRAELARKNESQPDELHGLAMTLVKFGISFTKRTLNQANALVNIYLDGTVLVSTGATEMGQGVNTRIRQLVADDLGIGYDRVFIAATNTDKNNNTSPTAASCGTDLNGAAALDACARIRQRLAHFAADLLASSAAGLPASPGDIVFADNRVFDFHSPEHTLDWTDLVQKAYVERISLGERGFYITPGVDFNRETGQGEPFLYFTNGAAVAEVCIDRYTGEMQVARVDLLMDAGIPINPGIDRGQIVGGFIQGQGWVTSEELRYDERGTLLSHSPTTYKIPDVSDVPAVFNMEFFENDSNVVSLKRSKAVGEPPLLLGISVWAAVKDALDHVAGSTHVPLRLPATGEEILMQLHTLQSAMTDPSNGQHGKAAQSLAVHRKE